MTMGSSYMSITYSYKLSRGFPRTIATFFRVGTFLQQHLAASGGMSLRSSSSTNSHLVNCFSLLISLFPFSKLHHLVHTIELKVFELQRKFEILAKGRIFMASFLHLYSGDSCNSTETFTITSFEWDIWPQVIHWQQVRDFGNKMTLKK